MNTSTRPFLPRAWIIAMLVPLLVLLGSVARAAGPVGEITLAIGRAGLERGAAPAQEPQKGTAVHQGDVIRTSSNGHVHIRFIDGALVSIRPNSIFSIQEFQYNPANPAASTVRLNLEAGEARAISGAAAQAAKERFRLNTPLVAIGVKGTDFITQAGRQTTRVTVNEGAIVMAPFDQACRADGLGACSGARARELRADMGALALIYHSGATDPSLQPARPGNGPGSDNIKLHLLERQQRENRESASQSVQLSTETRNPLDLLSPARMLWGRWANAPLPGDSLTIPFLDALRGNDVTVGDGYFFLFRQPGMANLLPSLTTRVDFGLQSAAAYYRLPSNDITAASVQSGNLSIDFATLGYQTSLNVAAAAAGAHTISFRGSINPDTGIFLAPPGSGTSHLAGALTLDASRAGYLFRAPVSAGGTFVGATLWGRP